MMNGLCEKYTYVSFNWKNKFLDYISDFSSNFFLRVNTSKSISYLKLMKIINKAMKEYACKDESIKKAILELAVYNEYATRITKRSCYQSGTPALLSLKRWLYPYWLMYLGIPKEEFPNYMMRDKIVFDERKYAYEKELKKLNIEEFIDFCIRNQRYIIRG